MLRISAGLWLGTATLMLGGIIFMMFAAPQDSIYASWHTRLELSKMMVEFAFKGLVYFYIFRTRPNPISGVASLIDFFMYLTPTAVWFFVFPSPQLADMVANLRSFDQLSTVLRWIAFVIAVLGALRTRPQDRKKNAL